MPTGIYKRTKEHCKNISKSHLGKKYSEETRKKLSEISKKNNGYLSLNQV